MLMQPFLYKKQNKKLIPGYFFKAIVKHFDYYVYDQLRVYADETIAGNYFFYNLPADRMFKHFIKFFPKLDKKNINNFQGGSMIESENAISFNDFKYLVRNNLVTLNYSGPVNLDLTRIMPHVDGQYIIDMDMIISNKDFIKSIEDVFCDLNNKPNSKRIFLNTLCEFLLSSKDDKELYRKKLQNAHLKLPEFERPDIYPLTIDMEGSPIEDILYRKEGRLDYYDDFVNVYDDMYFEIKYKKLGIKKMSIK